MQGPWICPRVAVWSKEVNARGLFEARPDGAGDGGHQAGPKPVGFNPVFSRVLQCRRQSELFSPTVWLVSGAFAQTSRRLCVGFGFDSFAARGWTSGRSGGGLYADGNQTVFASAVGGLERGSSGGQFLASSR